MVGPHQAMGGPQPPSDDGRYDDHLPASEGGWADRIEGCMALPVLAALAVFAIIRDWLER